MFNKIFNFIEKRWIEIMLVIILFLVLAYFIAFYCNGVYGMHFDLASIWTGVACISTSSILGVGKYLIDSKYNSPDKKKPYEKDVTK